MNHEFNFIMNLKSDFYKALQKKTSWGRNEIVDLLDLLILQILSDREKRKIVDRNRRFN